MSDSTREQLEEMQASLKERVEKLAKHVEHREEPIPADFAEQAVEMENEETMVALSQELGNELKDVEAALARLQKGTYGTCIQCSNQIQAGRLDALPATSVCLDCAQ